MARSAAASRTPPLRKLDDLPGDETRCGIVHHFQAQRVAHALECSRHFVDGLRIERLAGQKRTDRHLNNSATSISDISQLGLPGLYAIWAHGHEGVVFLCAFKL
jgi:hypothetical protein